MSKKIKVGVIGLGRIGMPVSLNELGNYSDLYEIVAVCDLIKDRRDKVANQFGCKTYERIEDLINESDAELIYIATRSCDHYAHALLALNANKSVVLEKPVTISYEQAADLFARANHDGKPRLFVHQQRRFETAFSKMYEIIILTQKIMVRDYTTTSSIKQHATLNKSSLGGLGFFRPCLLLRFFFRLENLHLFDNLRIRRDIYRRMAHLRFSRGLREIVAGNYSVKLEVHDRRSALLHRDPCDVIELAIFKPHKLRAVICIVRTASAGNRKRVVLAPIALGVHVFVPVTGKHRVFAA